MIQELNSVLIQYETSPRLLRWQWHGPVSDRLVMEGLGELLRFAQPRRPYYWLADVSNMAPIGANAQQWLNDTWLPRFVHLKGTRLAIILPQNIHNQLVLETMLASPRYGGTCDIQYFSDTLAALDWLVDANDSHVSYLEEEWQKAIASSGQLDHFSGYNF